MAFEQKEQKDGTGVLFVNDRKESEKHPDFTGKINVDGTLYRLAAWKKKGKKSTFLTLAISDFKAGGSKKEKEGGIFD